MWNRNANANTPLPVTLLIIQIAVILLLSAFFSGMEIAFVSTNKLRFEMDRASQSLGTRAAARFFAHPGDFISTLLVGNNIALVIYGILIAQLLQPWVIQPLHITNEWLVLLVQTLLSTAIVLVTGEFLPKMLFRINPNRTLTFFAPLAYVFHVVLYPISKLTNLLSRALLRLVGTRVTGDDTQQVFGKTDLDFLINESISKTAPDDAITEEVHLFQNALDFGTCKVRDCIVPRTEIIAASRTETLAQLRILFTESGYSKILVYDGDIDNITGFIHASEMFRLSASDDWTQHIRPVPIVPETMTAQRLMQTFMQEKKSIAVVVDEFGGTSGICTLEDLVEEIFGDIEDEHDNLSYTARRLPSGEYEISARLEIEKVNDLLGLDLPEDDSYQTVGGLLLARLQRFPKLNEVVTFDHYQFKIIKNTNTKIELVRLQILEHTDTFRPN